jgi:hypothetical protein
MRITQSLTMLLYPGNYSGPYHVSMCKLVVKALRESPSIKRFDSMMSPPYRAFTDYSVFTTTA